MVLSGALFRSHFSFIPVKILNRVRRASSCLLIMELNGVTGDRFRRACVRSLPVFVAMSTDDNWRISVSREKFHCAHNSFLSVFWNVVTVGAVMLWGISNVPSFESMRCPCVLVLWCLMNECIFPGKGERSDITVKGSVELRFCGESWVDL